MERTFLRSHVVAAMHGLIFASYCGLLAIALQPFPFVAILVAPPWGLLWILYTIPTYLGIVLVRGLAKRLGAYDLFTILAGVLALALSFGFDFASSIRYWLTSRGEIHGMILGAGPPPEDIGGWIFRALSTATWIGLMVAIGVAWKRSREKQTQPTALSTGEISKIYLWLGIDSLVIGIVTFAILSADLQQRREWSNPENVFDRAASVLNDKASSPGDRAVALNTISISHDPRANDLLRRAVHEETGQNQIAAAISLLGRDDMLSLSVLEAPLMQRSQIKGTLQPTTSHTPSEGNGVQIAGFSQSFNLGPSLSRVKDPAAAPILVQLMSSTDAKTREGAASALRAIMSLKERGWDHWVPNWPSSIDQSTVTDAMIAGLDDSDEMVRYFSVCTLMEINDNPHYPATTIFEDNKDEYIKEWKDWAKNRIPPPP